MVVGVVIGSIDLAADVVGEPGTGGFGMTGGTVLGGPGNFYGANLEPVLVDDRGSGGFFDDLLDAIDATTTPVSLELGDDVDPPDTDGGGFWDDLREVVGGDGGGFGSMLGEGGPDVVHRSLFDALDDVFAPAPMDDAPPPIIEDDWGGYGDAMPDPIPLPGAEVDDLDLDLGSVMSSGPDDSSVGDGDLFAVDLDADVMAADPIDIGAVDDLTRPEFETTDFGGDMTMPEMEIPEMQMPEVEMPEANDFEQAIQAADNVESSLDDLFGDLD